MDEAPAHRALPVTGIRLAVWRDPQDVFLARFADAAAGDVAWLDDSAGEGWSYLGASAGSVTDWPDGVFPGLAEMVAVPSRSRSDSSDHDPAHDLPAGLAFRLGVVGWIPYEAWSETVLLHHAPGSADAAAAPRPDAVPASAMRIERLLAFDHSTREVWAVARAGDRWLAGAESGIAGIPPVVGPADLADARTPSTDPDPDPDPDPASWRHDDTAYLALIRSCQESILRGDAYQLCLTNTARAGGEVDPVRVHLALRALSPTHHGGFLRVGGTVLVSASPERFVEVDADRTLRTLPIKGTRPRHADPVDDERARAELLASDKERAENVMIVDLMRNDLSRVCELGTVRVASLFAVEAYAQVHQLVSRVEGRLAAGVTSVDAVRALFPAGSMTGAPKSAAIGILTALESGRRGVYAGAFGWLGDDGRVDLAMVIRSVVVVDGRATIGAGGGITALSVPQEELEEVRVKAAPLLAAVRAGRIMPGVTASPSLPRASPSA